MRGDGFEEKKSEEKIEADNMCRHLHELSKQERERVLDFLMTKDVGKNIELLTTRLRNGWEMNYKSIGMCIKAAITTVMKLEAKRAEGTLTEMEELAFVSLLSAIGPKVWGEVGRNTENIPQFRRGQPKFRSFSKRY